jgi:hypothetical protein
VSDYAKAQATHWYCAGDKYSFTADPTKADPGEVERVGLHSCADLSCEEKHACNDEYYSVWLLACLTESRHRP